MNRRRNREYLDLVSSAALLMSDARPEDNPEYLRGMAELIGDSAFGAVIGMPLGERAEEITADIVLLAREFSKPLPAGTPYVTLARQLLGGRDAS